jgi:hypothetical protein
LKTQPDRTHTHGLGRNFCPKPNPTATLPVRDAGYESSACRRVKLSQSNSYDESQTKEI